jgi:tetratricopeptide (TPR) repeat protein
MGEPVMKNRPGEISWRTPKRALFFSFFVLLRFSLVHLITWSLVHSAVEAASPLGEAQRAFQLQGAHYGTLPDDDPAVLRARAIFKKIVRVAGSPPGASLSLFVLATPKIIAQSHGRGIIVISLGLLDRFGPAEEGLAFALGHEIAHQVRAHDELLKGLVRSSPGPNALTPSPQDLRTFQVLELDADRLGVLYASLAGYRVRAAAQTIAEITEELGPDEYHPDARLRAREVRRQIDTVLDHHEVYLLGLACLAMGRLEVAARIFEEFQSIYPSRELFLNVGVAYHKMALRYAGDDEFQRSILIDPRSRIVTTMRGPDQPTHPLFRQYLERATEAYRQAVNMDPGDPISHSNLGVAYLDGGQYEYALGEFRAALTADAGFVAAYNNRGIAYAKMGDLKRAETDLLDAASRDPQGVAAFRNLKAVYQQAGNAAEARKADEALTRLERARVPGTEPPGVMRVGDLRIGMAWEEAERIQGPGALRQIAVPLSVTPGDDLVLRIYGGKGLAVATEKGMVSAIGVLERGAAKLPGGAGIGMTGERLRQVLGTPGRIEGVREAVMWVYPDRGVVACVANGKVSGLWLVMK